MVAKGLWTDHWHTHKNNSWHVILFQLKLYPWKVLFPLTVLRQTIALSYTETQVCPQINQSAPARDPPFAATGARGCPFSAAFLKKQTQTQTASHGHISHFQLDVL